jgi:hypothetical protein
MTSGVQNMKTATDTLVSAENESGHAKREKRDPTPSVPPKMSQGAQIRKTGPDTNNTAEKEFRRKT